MSALRMYLFLFVAAIVASTILNAPNAAGSFSYGFQLGETLGSILILFLIASIFPTIWVLLFRKEANSRVIPIAIGFAVLVICGYLVHRGQEIERSSASTSFVFQPQGCTFSTLFPGEPEIDGVITADGNEIKQANFYARDAFFRSECLPIGTGFASTEALMEALSKYSAAYGLTNPEYRASSSDGLKRVSVRGWKKVAERVVILKIVMTTDGRSIMTVLAGGEAAGFPQQGVTEFLSSVRKLEV